MACHITFTYFYFIIVWVFVPSISLCSATDFANTYVDTAFGRSRAKGIQEMASSENTVGVSSRRSDGNCWWLETIACSVERIVQFLGRVRERSWFEVHWDRELGYWWCETSKLYYRRIDNNIYIYTQGYSKWLSGFQQLVIHNTLEIAVYVFILFNGTTLHVFVTYLTGVILQTSTRKLSSFQTVCSMSAVRRPPPS